MERPGGCAIIPRQTAPSCGYRPLIFWFKPITSRELWSCSRNVLEADPGRAFCFGLFCQVKLIRWERVDVIDLDRLKSYSWRAEDDPAVHWWDRLGRSIKVRLNLSLWCQPKSLSAPVSPKGQELCMSLHWLGEKLILLLWEVWKLPPKPGNI